MKKFLAMLVAAMMVLSLVAIPVLADGEVVFAVENAPATATPGDEITVNLTVNGTFEAHVLNMQFNYNADAFEYVSHTRGDVLNQIIDLGGTQLVDATTIPGSMRLGVMMPTAAFTQSGTICSVTLRVKEGAANGASDLALVITEFKNFPTGGQATPIANVVNNATVTITGGSEPTPVPPTEEPTPTQNPNTPAPGGMATISLTAGDVFSDGSGYQMLLDADATAFGNEIPAEGPLTQGGDAPAGLYDAFEYKIPVNADGSTTTSNIVINNTITIEVPAGTYDWCIANPTPGDRIWIASAQGNIGGRADDYEFEAGYTYNFTVYLLGQNDATDVEIIPGGGETPVITDSPTPVITNSPTPEPPTDTPEPGDETPTPEIPTDTPEPVTPAPGDVIFSVGGVHYVAAGSQVSVDLTINGEYEANGMNIWVQYDAEKLTLNSVDEGEIMKAIKDLGGMNILDFQSIPGSVRLGSMLPRDPVSGSGKIFTMNFTVAEGLEDGTEMPIEILVKEFFNMPVGEQENTPIAFFAENGSIVVGEAPVTEAPITDEPTAVPTDAPNPPVTGAMSLIGVGIAAIVASAGVVIFRKKEED